MDEQLIKRIGRLYAAIGDCIETDMNQLPAIPVSPGKMLGYMQDFRGNKTPEQLENSLQSSILLIGGLEYHLRRWAHHNQRDPELVTSKFKKSIALQIIHDLCNNEKHGYPLQQGKDRSGKAPKLVNVRRIMQLTTQPRKGSRVGMTLGPGGIPVILGDGNAAAFITGEVVNADNKQICDAHNLINDAVCECETLFQSFEIEIT